MGNFFSFERRVGLYMKTVFVMFGNHFDLLWRRCWEREYDYQDKHYLSYARVEELILDRIIELAEQGQGAYSVEQTLSMRAYLRKHPDALPRLQALYARGLFEMYGAGEAIIDVNMCSAETMGAQPGFRYLLLPCGAGHAAAPGVSRRWLRVLRAVPASDPFLRLPRCQRIDLRLSG